MVVPVVYRKASPIQVSYDWVDAMANVGYKRYYACAADKSGGDTFFLTTTSSIDSRPRYWNETANGAGTELNFDLAVFKRPVTLEGKAIFNCTCQFYSGSTMNVTLRLYHVDSGASETLIAPITTSGNISPGATLYYRLCIELDITKQAFKIGEKLRLAVVMTSTANHQRDIYHDPGTRTTVTADGIASTSTDMTLDVPFRLIQ